jgi:hypothetical protein
MSTRRIHSFCIPSSTIASGVGPAGAGAGSGSGAGAGASGCFGAGIPNIEEPATIGLGPPKGLP